ncbi:hypothetical protein BJ742DRAFT_735798 [Cladochytrium replicatum]|nr:hypothetical protein BJ742DRAFT_735798 [Cladochytrium replicatum]
MFAHPHDLNQSMLFSLESIPKPKAKKGDQIIMLLFADCYDIPRDCNALTDYYASAAEVNINVETRIHRCRSSISECVNVDYHVDACDMIQGDMDSIDSGVLASIVSTYCPQEIFDINVIAMVLKLQQRHETSDTDANFSGLDSPPYAITLIEEYLSIYEQLMIEQPADECIELAIEEFGDESFAIAEDPIAVSRINNPVDVDVDDHIPANTTNVTALTGSTQSPLDICDINSIVAVLQQEQYEPSETNGSESGLGVTTITLISETVGDPRIPNITTKQGNFYQWIPEQLYHNNWTFNVGVYPVDVNSEVTLGLYSKFHGRNGSNNLLSEAYTIHRTMTEGSNVQTNSSFITELALDDCIQEVRQFPILSLTEQVSDLLVPSNPLYTTAILNMMESISLSKSVASAQPFTDLPFDQDDNITADQRSEIVFAYVFGQNANLSHLTIFVRLEIAGGGGTGVSESNLRWVEITSMFLKSYRAGVTCHTKMKGPALVGRLVWQDPGLPETTPMIKIARKSFNILVQSLH